MEGDILSRMPSPSRWLPPILSRDDRRTIQTGKPRPKLVQLCVHDAAFLLFIWWMLHGYQDLSFIACPLSWRGILLR